MIPALLAALAGCATREDVQINAEESPQFGSAGKLPLPDESRYAIKRGFADYNGDGVTDMIEINDEVIFGQKWTGKIYTGERTSNGLMRFHHNYKVDLPINQDWFTSQTKWDTGDVNGDGFADVVMTQYTEGLFNDEYHIEIAMNAGDGETFKFGAEYYVEDKPLNLWIHDLIYYLLTDIPVDQLDRYFKMDWADMNGDKKDDLCIFWKDGADLRATVAYSKTSENEKKHIGFGGRKDFTIPGFLHNRYIEGVDTEDFTGDGFADIVSYDPFIGNGLAIFMASNNGNNTDPGFRLHKDFIGNEIEVDTFGFDKRDSFDINGDKRADYVHAGRYNGDPTLTYLLSQ